MYTKGYDKLIADGNFVYALNDKGTNYFNFSIQSIRDGMSAPERENMARSLAALQNEADTLNLSTEDIENGIIQEMVELIRDVSQGILFYNKYSQLGKMLKISDRAEAILSKLEDKMTKEELLTKLEACSQSGDTEASHSEADHLLLEYIGDKDITEAFESIEKWYS